MKVGLTFHDGSFVTGDRDDVLSLMRDEGFAKQFPLPLMSGNIRLPVLWINPRYVAFIVEVPE